jgi:hypothetical protein
VRWYVDEEVVTGATGSPPLALIYITRNITRNITSLPRAACGREGGEYPPPECEQSDRDWADKKSLLALDRTTVLTASRNGGRKIYVITINAEKDTF